MTTPDPARFGDANGVYCRFCGATPAIDMDFRAHRGMILMMQFRKLPGPYCRTCGLASFRKMTGDSLVQGWWGPFSFVFANPGTLLLNLVNRARLAQLPPPIPGAPSPPMDPGTPLFLRPHILGALVPILLVAFVFGNSAKSSSSSSADRSSDHYLGAPSTTYAMPIAPPAPTTPAARGATAAIVGDCVRDTAGDLATDQHPKIEVVPCSDPQAQATVLGKPMGANAEAECDSTFPDADVVLTHKTSYGNGPEFTTFALCLTLK
ncbi:hypothetical protein ACFXPR_16005 [Nocardia tengchongensis]|uniref:LppU/SCO3897 family protein n=1 Tax=Nocardia tengchongensis TaxID=2055889 RepID=UPI0036BF1090